MQAYNDWMVEFQEAAPQQQVTPAGIACQSATVSSKYLVCVRVLQARDMLSSELGFFGSVCSGGAVREIQGEKAGAEDVLSSLSRGFAPRSGLS